MAINIHTNRYQDNHQKMECQSCKRGFIVGERLSEGMDLSCPYCRSKDIEWVSSTTDEILGDLDFGCSGLYFNLHGNRSLMLYTGAEFLKATQENADNHSGAVLNDLNQIMSDFCKKRDNTER